MEQTHIQKSVYCDFDHPAVAGLARELANGEPDPAKVTMATFKCFTQVQLNRQWVMAHATLDISTYG
jgi:hypothetical protein